MLKPGQYYLLKSGSLDQMTDLDSIRDIVIGLSPQDIGVLWAVDKEIRVYSPRQMRENDGMRIYLRDTEPLFVVHDVDAALMALSLSEGDIE